MKFKSIILNNKVLNCLIAGMFIAIAACLCVLMPYHWLGASVFPVGIFLVILYAPMLLTKGWPNMLSGNSGYKMIDIIKMIIFNSIGCIIVSGIFCLIVKDTFVQDKIFNVVNTKLGHSSINDLVLATACGAVVASTGIPAKFTKNKIISNIAIWGLIFSFVYFKFEHSIADVYYFSLYSFLYGFKTQFILKSITFIIGNLIGGGLVGYFVLRKLKNK